MIKSVENIIFNDFMSKFTREKVIELAKRDEEKPFGYIICWIRSVYGIPKTDGWNCAERICKKLKIDY